MRKFLLTAVFLCVILEEKRERSAREKGDEEA